MIGPAPENPRKNTGVKKQKNMDSAYPVRLEKQWECKDLPPTIGNPLPATGPILSGPHTIDRMNTGDTPSNPAASTSVNRMPTPSRGATKSPAARKSANYPKPPSTNKLQRKPLSASATQSIATNATTPSANVDDEAQASSSSQNEVERDLREIMEENEASLVAAKCIDVIVAAAIKKSA